MVLAKEAGLCYAAVAMATDYDCWHPHNEKVSVDLALKTFRENVGKVTQVLCAAVPIIAKQDWTATISELKVPLFHLLLEFFSKYFFCMIQETVKSSIML